MGLLIEDGKAGLPHDLYWIDRQKKACQKKKHHLVLGILFYLLQMIFLSTHDQALDCLM